MQFMTLDRNLASQANSSSRIGSHSYHVTKITQAYAGVSQNGAKFVSLNFANASGESADEIKVYYENAQGERLSGAAQLNAIMAFNNVEALSQQQGTYKSYDFNAGGLTDKQGLIVPELFGKYVGIILSENWYINQNGEPKHTLNLSAVYHHKTAQNARQFLNNEQAVEGQVEKSIVYAERISADSKAKAQHKPMVAQQKAQQGYTPKAQQGYTPKAQQGYTPKAQTGNQASDDDMPF